jgi:purine-binding chemotaxis protein CheW
MTDSKPITQGQETKAIDWSEVHQRLAAIQRAIERGATPSPDEKKAILKARARALAQNPNEQKTISETVEILEFLLGNESYGIETSFVRELYRVKDFTPLPGTPAFVLGITSVRGEILSVIDMKKFFALPEMETTDHNKVIIVHNEAMEFCIPADYISGVRLLPLEDIKPPPPTLTGISTEYLRGVTSERMVILDAEKILSDKKIVVDEEVRT